MIQEYERLMWVGVLMLVIAGGAYLVHHLESVGIAKQQAVDAKAEVIQTERVHKAETNAEIANSLNAAELQAALSAPVLPSFVLSVCPSPAHRGNDVPADGSARGEPLSPGGLRQGVGAPDVGTGIDIAKPTETILARANAEVKYWQEYYRECKAAGACR